MTRQNAFSRKGTSRFYKLLGFDVTVPTEEQIATYEYPDSVKATLVVHLEPLSFRYVGEGGAEIETNDNDRIPLTSRLTPEERQAVREHGFGGVPMNKLARDGHPKGTGPFERLVRSMEKVGINVDFDEDGVYCDKIGHIFETVGSMDYFPTWNPDKGRRGEWDFDNTRPRFMRYFVAHAPDFVAPLMEERDVIIRAPRQVEVATAVTGQATSDLSATRLLEAAITSGMIGMSADLLDSDEEQSLFVYRAAKKDAIFGSEVIVEAAQNGKLLDFFTQQGAIDVDDDGDIVPAN